MYQKDNRLNRKIIIYWFLILYPTVLVSRKECKVFNAKYTKILSELCVFFVLFAWKPSFIRDKVKLPNSTEIEEILNCFEIRRCQKRAILCLVVNSKMKTKQLTLFVNFHFQFNLNLRQKIYVVRNHQKRPFEIPQSCHHFIQTIQI